MIKSLRNGAARAAWERRFIEGMPREVLRIGNRKLVQPHNARSLVDLRAPPGNRLEVLGGDLAGQHRTRINDQWRLCFVPRDDDAFEVDIVDYHWGTERIDGRFSPDPTRSSRAALLRRRFAWRRR